MILYIYIQDDIASLISYFTICYDAILLSVMTSSDHRTINIMNIYFKHIDVNIRLC